MSLSPPVRLGFIPASRGFFSSELARDMRDKAVAAITRAGCELVVPEPGQTKDGCVETREEAEFCADLFRRNDVDGIIIGAVNFGDEQAAAWTVKQARLDVPVLIFGCPEAGPLTPQSDRRDAFCGLLSIAEALRQIDVPYTVAKQPILFPDQPVFLEEMQGFAGICRVVRGVRRARYGQIGARPDAFWTCRFSEAQLQRLGPTTVVMDLSELIAGVNRIDDHDPEVKARREAMSEYATPNCGIAASSLDKLAKLELVLANWVRDQQLDGLAVQCWTSIQQNLGVCTCAPLSRLSNIGIPCACEADILGTLSMHACQLASGHPAALADWNNLHHEDDELVNLFHCGVYPSYYAQEKPRMEVHRILAGSGAVPAEQAAGTVEFCLRPCDVTLCRVTQGAAGDWKAVLAHGRVESHAEETFGSYGWCRVPQLQRLYRDILLQHFPHHVGFTEGHVGATLWEAFGRYLNFGIYHSAQPIPGHYTPTILC